MHLTSRIAFERGFNEFCLYPATVTGALVAKETVQSMWTKATSSFLNENEQMHLYWLDEGGYVITSNQNIEPGTFIGSKKADPQV